MGNRDLHADVPPDRGSQVPVAEGTLARGPGPAGKAAGSLPSPVGTPALGR